MFDFVEFDIDDERSEFLRSLAYRGSWPPTYVVVPVLFVYFLAFGYLPFLF
jgi:hypothetical protein